MRDVTRAGDVVTDEHLMAVLLGWWCEQELTQEEYERGDERQVALDDMTDLLGRLSENGYEIVRKADA